MRLTTLLAALAGAVGCLGIPRTPGISEAMRVEHGEASPTLRLHCQSPEVDQARLTDALEAQRRQISSQLGLPAVAPPLNLYVFANQAAYETHVAAKFPNFPSRRAIFVRDAQELAVYTYCSPLLATDLRHEATHGYLHAALPTLPLWLDEGLAEYYEVAAEHHGHNRGHTELLRTQQATGGWTPDLAALEQLRDAGAMTQLEYAESWLWVHFLLHGSEHTAELLRDYLADLSDGAPSVPLSTRLRQFVVQPNDAALRYLAMLSAAEK